MPTLLKRVSAWLEDDEEDRTSPVTAAIMEDVAAHLIQQQVAALELGKDLRQRIGEYVAAVEGQDEEVGRLDATTQYLSRIRARSFQTEIADLADQNATLRSKLNDTTQFAEKTARALIAMIGRVGNVVTEPTTDETTEHWLDRPRPDITKP